MLKKILLSLIILISGIFIYNFFLGSPAFSIGEKAPQINGKLISGENFSLSELEGNYVLIDFWGSWCGPCRKAMPKLKSLYSQYHDREFADADNFEILSIALEKSDKYTRQIIDRENLSWNYHIIDISKIVLMSSYAQLYGVREVPTHFLLNTKGELMGVNLPFEEISRILSRRVK